MRPLQATLLPTDNSFTSQIVKPTSSTKINLTTGSDIDLPYALTGKSPYAPDLVILSNTLAIFNGNTDHLNSINLAMDAISTITSGPLATLPSTFFLFRPPIEARSLTRQY